MKPKKKPSVKMRNHKNEMGDYEVYVSVNGDSVGRFSEGEFFGNSRAGITPEEMVAIASLLASIATKP